MDISALSSGCRRRFSRSPIDRGWREGAWKASRHGEFQGRLGLTGTKRHDQWPYNCQYFTAHVMDPTEAIDLNARDTEYLEGEEFCPYIDFAESGPVKASFQLNDTGLSQIRDMNALPFSGTRVLFIPQWRLYSTTYSTIQLGMKETTWTDLLSILMIPPNVVELLHENNGGSWQHVSHCNDNATVHRNVSADHTGPCAYHICFKTSQFELMYARHDFHSKRNLILIMGVNLHREIERLTSQFKGLPSVHLFHILLAVLGTWLQKLEQSRWSLDFSVLQLEQNTGFGQLVRDVVPSPTERLFLQRNDTAGAQGYIRSVARHSICTGDFFGVLEEALSRFLALQDCQDDSLRQPILDALGQYQSQQRTQAVQAHDLSWRIDTQWDVLVALSAKRDSDVNIAMAQDARTDSLLMRKMASVSIVFLPATFLATFFSMMFFRVDDAGHLNISQNIWVYFAFTSAMSLLIGLYFRFSSRCRSFFHARIYRSHRSASLVSDVEKIEDSA
ncbi:uncharacterized protein A1O9_11323 [Exophiala aquamarina CBS 119918]|uniref:Uncharacterized protein n=1 Tax=Exophiala aquamarina CBS 119918 TaxID=1182545 RepID=A0A072NXY7_9EURO|nr:uncharacterized protein A1O9_11323 [Exophiala aquamarina CBS 119918]KEF52481.1 hypothetical protein A1O9_11323 [Exophiala aquamarina CBS 119918]